jgi:hypothetical protein
MPNTDLENIVTSDEDTLPNLLKKYDPNSIQHSDEIYNASLMDYGLRYRHFWTADFPLYYVKGGKVFLYLARGKDNLVFRNIKDAEAQILETGNYIPSEKDAHEVMNSAATFKVNLSNLWLHDYDGESSYFEVMAPRHDWFDPYQKAFVGRVFGSEDNFKEYMKILRQEKGRISAVIKVLNPNYVRKNVGKGKFLCRISVLSDRDQLSYFEAGSRGIDNNNGRVRGVRLFAAEGDVAPKIEADPVLNAYDLILNPNDKQNAPSLMALERDEQACDD